MHTCIYFFYVLPCSTRSPSSPRHGWLNSLRTHAGFQTRLCIHTILSERACIMMAITNEAHAPRRYNVVVDTPVYRWLTPFLPRYFLCISDTANFFPLIVVCGITNTQKVLWQEYHRSTTGVPQEYPPWWGEVRLFRNVHFFSLHSSVSLQLSACWHGRRVGLLTRDH